MPTTLYLYDATKAHLLNCLDHVSKYDWALVYRDLKAIALLADKHEAVYVGTLVCHALNQIFKGKPSTTFVAGSNELIAYELYNKVRHTFRSADPTGFFRYTVCPW